MACHEAVWSEGLQGHHTLLVYNLTNFYRHRNWHTIRPQGNRGSARTGTWPGRTASCAASSTSTGVRQNNSVNPLPNVTLDLEKQALHAFVCQACMLSLLL